MLFIQDKLLPPICPLCDAAAARYQLCPACHADLPVVRHPCRRCGVPLQPRTGQHHHSRSHHSGNAGLCGQCQHSPPAYDKLTSPLLYQSPVSNLIHQFKYHRHLHLGPVLANLLACSLSPLSPGRWPDVIIPVPLHKAKQQHRGFNQSMELAKQLSLVLTTKIGMSLVYRCKATDDQSQLGLQQRKLNMRNAFSIKKPFHFRHVAIIDDVVTTGCTVNELASLLKKQGVDYVEVWSVARTVTRT